MELRDYELLADHAVGQLVSSEVPLSDSIVKIAEKNDLNPDQIKRVVEMVNTKAFLKMFKDPENKEKNIEFKVADPKEVLGKVYGDDKKSVTITRVTVSSGEGDSPMGFGHTLKEVLQGANTHTEDPSPLFEESASPSPNRKVIVLRLKKVASNLREDILDKEHTYINGVEKLASEFRKIYGPDFGEFEKNAYLLHGEEVAPIMQDLRLSIKWTADKQELEKVAGANVVDETAELVTLTHIFNAKCDQAKYARAIKVAQEKIEVLSA